MINQRRYSPARFIKLRVIGKIIVGPQAIIDSKTYITGWTENQENERKFRKLQSGMQKI